MDSSKTEEKNGMCCVRSPKEGLLPLLSVRESAHHDKTVNAGVWRFETKLIVNIWYSVRSGLDAQIRLGGMCSSPGLALAKHSTHSHDTMPSTRITRMSRKFALYMDALPASCRL